MERTIYRLEEFLILKTEQQRPKYLGLTASSCRSNTDSIMRRGERMAQAYSYRARNLSGQMITGRIQAESSSAVVALLRSRNLFVVQIRQLRAQTALGFGLERFFKKRIGVRTMAIFCRQFATLNKAGIPILQCLHIMAKQTEDRQMKKILGDVATEIERGSGLSEAFRKYKDHFPDIFISMIAAGELSGTLDQAMERLAVTFEREHALREKIKSAMTYPVLIGIMAVMSVISLLIFVVPIFVDIFKQAGATLPLPTRILLAASNIMIHYWWIILPLLIVHPCCDPAACWPPGRAAGRWTGSSCGCRSWGR